jgi:LPXTG-site transpeptidase (sortase) family protein
VIYAGGSFSDAGGDPDADRIAQFSGGSWSSLGGTGTGLNSTVRNIEISGGVIYAGGFFSEAGEDPDANRIAQYGLDGAGEDEDGAGGDEGNPSDSKEIDPSGTTTLQLGRIIVSVPEGAVQGQTNCRLGIEDIGTSGQFGFTLDDTVWDVDIVCDGVNQHIFFAPISICIRPEGSTAGKQVFHRDDGGGAWGPLAVVDGLSGYVCAETRVLSLFTLGSVSLPATGFAPDITAELGAEVAYAATGLTLDIPTLDVHLPIVGVPQTAHGWDVSWLGNSAGFLQGTSFPTLAGNTVITAHVWGADNQPGPFAGLERLSYGEKFTISAWGQTFTYEVRGSERYSPSALSPLGSEDYDWVTLVTCEGFNEAAGEYAYRRVVRAVLVAVD